VEVDRVLLEQVRPHDHAHVAEGEEQFVILIDCNQRRRNVAVHHSHVEHLAGIYVPIQAAARDSGSAYWVGETIQVGNQPDGAVVGKRRKRIWTGACEIGCGWVTGLQGRSPIHGIEFVGEVRPGLAVSDLRETRQRSEGKQVRLRAVAHRRVTVTARDLLAFDSTVHVSGRRRISARARVSRAGVRRFRSGRHWVSDRAGWTLHAE